LLFNFALEYVIGRLQTNQKDLKLHCTHRLLRYADDVNPLNTELNPICHLLEFLGAHHILHVNRIRFNIWGGSVHIIKENTEAIIVASK